MFRLVVVSLCFAADFTVGPEFVEGDEVKTFRQIVERQPLMERGSPVEAAVPEKPVISDSVFSEGIVPKWIWGVDNNSRYVLRQTVTLSGVRSARVRASCDNVGAVFLNGKRVAGSSEWQDPMDADVTGSLRDGENLIEAEVENQGGVAAFVLKLAVLNGDGRVFEFVTDETWQALKTRDDQSPVAVTLRGTYGGGPWGHVFERVAVAGRVPPGVFEVLPGFQVDRLFTVPKEELGSWVCIAFDNKGRLLASDQGDKGICRITLPPLKASHHSPAEGQSGREADERGSDGASAATIVERLDFTQCEYQPSGAHGMLWAFDALYLSVNGGPGSGLYRAKDTDGDDQFDECVKLKEFRGGGEHGPHSLRLSPDGQRIFVIAGNHTKPPFEPGEELQNQNFTSRIPTNWGEDHLLPRMWDANGHARGILAPGGWIASTDPEGTTWDLFSIGYRNPYDMAFNADGELFAYDADMEWDVGMPWYRPTRVVHATSGSEFGWRSGSGKWPTYYPDSLPPLVEIGPGSPVGVEFGYGLKFPEKYQKALYLCDWTFGTMYAIHTVANQSTYSATKEEFLSRSPLPLTDVAAGPDGALYFSVGGRGTQSELFRVTYSGSEPVEPTNVKDNQFADARAERRVLEELHTGSTDLTTLVRKSEPLRTSRRTADRHMRNAGQVAAMHLPTDDIRAALGLLLSADVSAAFTDGAYDTLDLIQVLARGSRETHKVIVDGSETPVENTESREIAEQVFLRFRPQQFSDDLLLSYLRSLSLAVLRLGAMDDKTNSILISQLDPLFPSSTADVNRELCQMLVSLKSPTIIGKTVKLLEAPSIPTVTEDMKELLARNRGYGGAIAASIEKAPDQQQIWYAFCLRHLKNGWTMDQRKAYFAWFERAHTWAGGASFHGFLRNIESEAFENATEKERLLIEASGARKPYVLPEIPAPAGPGRDWTLEEVRALATVGLKQRDFENGQKMFSATRCILCHRFAGDGGATGPDLTQLAGRFNLNDLTEAIMVPGKVISDQYKGTTIVTTDGRTVSGRIVSESDDTITLLTNPEDSTKIAEIRKSEIEETQPSAVSMMPADLLKTLNQDEVLDLLAYLLSRGEKNNAMFRKSSARR